MKNNEEKTKMKETWKLTRKMNEKQKEMKGKKLIKNKNEWKWIKEKNEWKIKMNERE